MNNRINLLLKTEGLSNSKFASILGIQRSNITHIIDGRNKPSLSFIEKLMSKFPRVNIEWLINGTGEMYKQPVASGQKDPSPTLFTETGMEQLPDNQEKIKTVSQSTNPQAVQKSKQSTKMHTKPESESIPELLATETLINEALPPKNTGEPKPQTSQLNTIESDLIEKNKDRDIEFVLIFYTDKTFKHYKLI
jgi:transcriptional regulator with XRE-family HTH domain